MQKRQKRSFKLRKSLITRQRIDGFHSILIQSLITWHPIYYTPPRSHGQRPTWHNISAAKKRYKSVTDGLTKFKLDENYLKVQHNMW